MLAALLLTSGGGWVTKMQSLYGVQASHHYLRLPHLQLHLHNLLLHHLLLPPPPPPPPPPPSLQASHAASIWAGSVNETGVYETMGYYWHAPQDFDSNRGLGCGGPHPPTPPPLPTCPAPIHRQR